MCDILEGEYKHLSVIQVANNPMMCGALPSCLVKEDGTFIAVSKSFIADTFIIDPDVAIGPLSPDVRTQGMHYP